MIKFLVPMLLISNVAFAGISVCRDEATNKVTNFSLRGNPLEGCHYFDVPGVSEQDYENLRTLLKTVDRRYLKMIGTTILSVMEMSPPEKVSVDEAWAAEIQAQVLADSRSGAKNSVDQLSAEGVRLRASLLVVMEEMNALRTWLADFKAQVALASSLNDLKTRVATLPATPDRTASQLKTAIKNKIDAGSAD